MNREKILILCVVTDEDGLLKMKDIGMFEDSKGIVTVVEEDGELKISEAKAFTDPEQRKKMISWGANALAQEGIAAQVYNVYVCSKRLRV